MEPVTRNFWLGCALWGYKSWVGEFFPSGSRAANFLKLYSERLTAVEGNTTFYSVPDAKTTARWVAETPPDFRFCPKFPKLVTHQGALTPKLDAAKQFIHHMQGLGVRLGPMFIQLPPSYSPTQWNDLTTFLAVLADTQMAIGLEVRHLDWFKPPFDSRLTELLTALQIGRVLLDTRPIYDVPDDRQLAAERKKPKVPAVYSLTADFCLIRYISHPNWHVNLPFLQDWIRVVEQELPAGKYVYFFVHCPVEERSPGHARAIQHLFEQHNISLPYLPWNHLNQDPAQLNLL
jgi:uncharacterized protein YecE (DUF72 family)